MPTRTRPRAPSPPPAPAAGDVDAHAASAVQVLRHFRQVFNAVKTHYRLVEKQTGVGGALVWAMSLIDQQPGIGMGELARRMDIHQSTTSNLVKTLIERDMVEGVREGRDRRAVQLHLRPAGAKVLRRAPQPFSGVLHQALGALDAATLARLEQDLGALIHTLGPPARAERVPMVQA
jgi:DNA-binding MarR family transcriptional regulator